MITTGEGGVDSMVTTEEGGVDSICVLDLPSRIVALRLFHSI